MIRHEQLLEQYEEAFFALLMEENAPKWEEELEKELTALEADPAAAVPPENDRRNVVTIRSALAQEGDRQRRNRGGRGRLRPLLAAACLALAFLAGGFFGPQLALQGALRPLLTGVGVVILPGSPLELTLGWLPQGWTLVRTEATADRAMLYCTDGMGGTLRLELCAPPVAATVATTWPKGAEKVTVKGCEAVLAQVGGRLELSWRTQTDHQVGIEATGLDREDLLTLAKELKY